ncbi:MAG: hypothetical protein IKY33_02320 [Clostridia bacterium]|nr:hypothetical protein [Clostridia bacterium]
MRNVCSTVENSLRSARDAGLSIFSVSDHNTLSAYALDGPDMRPENPMGLSAGQRIELSLMEDWLPKVQKSII